MIADPDLHCGPDVIGRALARRWLRRRAAVRRLAAPPDPAAPVVVLAHPAAVAEATATARAVAAAAFVPAERALAAHLWHTTAEVEAEGYLFTLDSLATVRAERIT